MRIGIQASYSGDFTQTAAELRDLESAGLDVAMVAEVYTFDAVSQLGYLAAVTERVELMSGILPIYSRTPALTAMTAAGLDFVSGGRFTLGLGASGPQVIEGFHGVRYDAPIGRTREIIDICRQVWRREKVSYQGRHYTIPLPPEQGTGLGKPLKLINHPVRERIPILVAALGPKNVALVAEKAEGWQPLFFVPEKAQEIWGESLAEGNAKREAGLGPLEVYLQSSFAITEDEAVATQMLDGMRGFVALYLGGMGAKGKNFYNDVARRYGYVEEAEAIQDLYLDGKKEQAAAAVPEELLRAISLIGPRSYVAERMAAFAEAGVTTLNITPLAGTAAERVALVGAAKELASAL